MKHEWKQSPMTDDVARFRCIHAGCMASIVLTGMEIENDRGLLQRTKDLLDEKAPCEPRMDDR